jgi:glycosyltransferase involved in cell wall biosynthesis
MRISIITVVLNREKTIGRAILSLQSQTYKDIEHIIVDGKSTDSTLSIVKSLIRKKDRLISESDNGIYDAINKGLTLATGDVIGILHSDDIYRDKYVIEKVAREFLNNHIEMVYGDASFFHGLTYYTDKRLYRSKPLSIQGLSWGWMPAHPSIFFHKNVYKVLGPFKTNYEIAADYEFLCRVAKHGVVNSKYIPEVLIRMQLGGVSSSSLKNTCRLNIETLRACRENGIKTNLIKILSKYPFKLMEFL